MKVTALAATPRIISKESTARAVRLEKRVPGVLYGLEQNIHFSVNALELRKLIYTPDFSLVDVEIDGKKHRCIIKDYQAHPVTDAITHVDMLALKDGRPIKVDIPVRFVGVSPGVKAGGSIIRKLRKVKIKTTPENLVEEFEVDISHLNLGDSVRVRDMKVADNIQVLNSGPIPLASVEVPRALKSAEAAAEGEEGEEGAEEEGEDAAADE